MRRARCKSCGAHIVFAELVKRNGEIKTHPFDSAPASTGSFELRRGKQTSTYYARYVSPRQRGDGALYTSHYATCPFADRHRAIRRG